MNLCRIFLPLSFQIKKPRNPEYPPNIITIGDHIWKVRLDEGLCQPDVASIINVTTDCIPNWELNRTIPRDSYMKDIIVFPRYLPYKLKNANMSLGLKIAHKIAGLSQTKFANNIKVDQSTITFIEN